MRKRYLLYLTLLIASGLFSGESLAQQMITGRIISAPDKITLPGATVVVKGTTNGTTTDGEGKYAISAPAGATLVASFVGFQSQEILVGSQSVIDLMLTAENNALDEVVVVGYGTQKRRDLTGAIVSVNAQAIKEMPITSAEQGLQGRLAGVQVIQSNSAPGGAISIRVRGGNSVMGGNEPLYVIDGFPVYNSIGSNDGQTQPSNPLSSINPNDIVSMEVLKDASATAIYGARGANGVVIITTKRGKSAAGRVDFDAYVGVQSVRNKIPMLNARQYMEIANERARNIGSATLPFATPGSWTADTDWQDEIMRKASVSNYSLGFSGGSEASRYAVSGNWFDQKGIVTGSGFKRGSLRLNLDNNINSRLSLATSITLSRTMEESARSSLGTWNGVMYMALAAPPVAPVYNEDGTYYSLGKVPTAEPQWNNPLALAKGFLRNNVSTRILANTNLTYILSPDFTFSVRLGADNSNSRMDQYLSKVLIGSDGQASVSSYGGTTFLNENILSYKKRIGNKNSIDAMAGFTMQNSVGTSVSAGSQNYASDIFGTDNLGAGGVINAPGSDKSKNSLLSWLGRVNYSLNDKYLFTVSARADGSSRFGNGNKWGFFPSAAIAWRLSEEEFVKKALWINDLKLRASTGRTGNQEIGNYNSLARLSSVSVIFGSDQSRKIGYGVTTMPNPELRWETTTQYDAGIDASLWNRKVNVTLDYYIKNTTDLLAQVPVAISSGFASILLNSGSIRNHGFEVSVDALLVERNRLKWNAGVNFSTNKNKVQKVAVASGEFFAPSFSSPIDVPVNIVREGQPISAFYGYKTDGLWESDQDASSLMPGLKAGDQRYLDLNGDGAINTSDRTILGKPNPDFIYGITSQLSYGRFDLNLLFQGVHGATVFNANKYSIGDAFARGANQLAEVQDRWTSENPNPNALYPRASIKNPLVSDRFFEDASYFRLRNIQLGFNIPTGDKISKWIRDARIYVSGQNLLTWTKYSGFDPEVSSTGGADLRKGVDVGAYPSAKTITAGIKLGF
ncbi:TonB-dependent receptor [Dyadobacter sp. LHD-138]|uniref:SusC/RagA family TonB-linked outer membrane protein n=1 Tax=Dyadobacter sp. LHD-138 TaxID=3071413 RepID=UPI0027E124B6|nr:TonB-dependent receptor [Dyadobacter sp. LHD-138]MDQ6481676.1 TonB-dependent receptor [Dyadobacter sp. LHD-138]